MAHVGDHQQPIGLAGRLQRPGELLRLLELDRAVPVAVIEEDRDLGLLGVGQGVQALDRGMLELALEAVVEGRPLDGAEVAGAGAGDGPGDRILTSPPD